MRRNEWSPSPECAELHIGQTETAPRNATPRLMPLPEAWRTRAPSSWRHRPLRQDFDVEDETVSLDRVLQAMEPAKRLRLVILDACRQNPFADAMKRTVAARSVAGLAGPNHQQPIR
jgi:hypothetical protein